MRRNARLAADGSPSGLQRWRIRLVASLSCALLSALCFTSFAQAQRGTVEVVDAGGNVSAVAVNDTTGDFYAIVGNTIKVFDSTGALKSEFGTPGSGAGQLKLGGSTDIAIDQASGDVYVLEGGNNRVSKFDATGNFLLTFGWDVNQTQAGSAPEVCPRVGFPGDVCQAGERRLNDPGALGNPQIIPPITPGAYESRPATSLAIGPGGNVYTSEDGDSLFAADGASGNFYEYNGNRRIQVFSSRGEFLSTFPVPYEPLGCEHTNGGPRPNPCFSQGYEPADIAVDPDGATYTIDPLKRFAPGGAYLGHLADDRAFAPLLDVAVDRATNQIYLYQAATSGGKQFELAVYDKSGALDEEVARGLPQAALLGNASGGIAVKSGSTRAYASDGTNRIFVIDTLADLPSATISAASDITSSSAKLHGSASSASATYAAGYHFEYRAEGETLWRSVSQADVSIPSGMGSSPAEQELKGLDPNTTYHVRLVVTRDLGAGFAVSGEASFTTDPEKPVLSLIAPTRVTDTTAVLRAAIDARHAQTTYYFEYGPEDCATSVCTSVPLGQDGDAGSALGLNYVAEQLEGLQPQSTYHFRLIASNSAGTTTGDDMTFTTRSVAEMVWPERGIEMVSDPDKGNQNIFIGFPQSGQPILAHNASEVLWSTASATPNSTTGNLPWFRAERTVSGWLSQPLTPEVTSQPGHGAYAYSLRDWTPDLSWTVYGVGPVIGEQLAKTLVRIDRSGRQEVIEDMPPVGNSEERRMEIADDGQVIYQNALTHQIYSFDDTGKQALSMPSCGALLSKPAIASAHASAVLVTSAGDGDCSGPSNLYLLDPDTDTVTQISGPPVSGEDRGVLPRGSAISSDGNTVIFRSLTALDESDTNGARDFYRWRAGSGNECLTCSVGGVVGEYGQVSSDLSRIYFDSGSAIYVWHDGEVHHAFSVNGNDRPFGQIQGRPDGEGAFLTPDGSVAVFGLARGGATADRCSLGSGTPSSSGCSQVYRYDDETGVTECVSCRSGAGPQLGEVKEIPGSVGALSIATSEDANTIAFITDAPLVPEDINAIQDVYEWHNGVVRLVTDGVGEWPTTALASLPKLYTVSADGTDVIFSLAGQLTGFEQDNFASMYDARIGGGFPVLEPPAPCAEDSCQGPLQAPPPMDQPASSRFSGPVNQAAIRKKAKAKKKQKKRQKQQRRAHKKAKRAAHNNSGGSHNG